MTKDGVIDLEPHINSSSKDAPLSSSQTAAQKTFIDIIAAPKADKNSNDQKQSTQRVDRTGDGMRDQAVLAGPNDGMLVTDVAVDGSSETNGQINVPKEIAFALWKTEDERQAELNEKGTVDAGELQAMEQAGIRLIDLMPSKDDAKTFADKSMMTGISQALMNDGTKMLGGDVSLAYRPSTGNIILPENNISSGQNKGQYHQIDYDVAMEVAGHEGLVRKAYKGFCCKLFING